MPTLRSSKKAKTSSTAELLFKHEYHRLLLDYEILLNTFISYINDEMKFVKENFEATHHSHDKYVKICAMYDKLTDQVESVGPYTFRVHEIMEESYETILLKGDTWESLLIQIRGALYERQALTHEFFKDMSDFLHIYEDEKHDNHFLSIQGGPLRLIKHMMGVLKY